MMLVVIVEYVSFAGKEWIKLEIIPIINILLICPFIMTKKVLKNVKSNIEDLDVEFVSDKILIDEEDDIKVLEHISAWEVLMKGKSLYDMYGSRGPQKYTIVWEPYSKWNVQFIDRNTIQAIKDIKKWWYIRFADDEWHKPLLFRAPNMFVYKLCMAVTGLIIAVIYVWLLLLVFYTDL